MTVVNDNFSTLAISSWLKDFSSSSGDITVSAAQILSADTDDMGIMGPVASQAISSWSDGEGTAATLTTAISSDMVDGTYFVYITGATAGTYDPNGWWQATVSSTTTMTFESLAGVALENDAGDPFSGGTIYYPSAQSSAEQRFGVLSYATAAADDNHVTVWARWDAEVDKTAGYGVRLEWGLTTRTLTLLKLDAGDGSEYTLASTDVTHLMNTVSSSDIEVSQYIGITVTDVKVDESQSADREAWGVLVRAYLNDDSLGNAVLEVKDFGQTSGTYGVHRDPGQYGISLSGDVAVDAWEGETGFVFPEFGAYSSEFRSLSEMRAAVTRYLSRSSATSLEDVVVNEAINDAIVECIEELGDNALFLQRFELMRLTMDSSTHLVTMPGKVERVEMLADGSGRDIRDWKMVGYDEAGRLLLSVTDLPSGRDYYVRYYERIQPLEVDEDECPIPKRYDECVRAAAALRLSGEGERDSDHSRTLYARFKRSIERLHKEMNRFRRQNRPRMHYRRGQSGYRYAPSWQVRGPY